jgi:hypothetical protein
MNCCALARRARSTSTTRSASQKTEMVRTRYGEYTAESAQESSEREGGPKGTTGDTVTCAGKTWTSTRTPDVAAPSSGYPVCTDGHVQHIAQRIFCQPISVEVRGRSRAHLTVDRMQEATRMLPPGEIVVLPAPSCSVRTSGSTDGTSAPSPLSQRYVLSPGAIPMSQQIDDLEPREGER